MKEFQADDDYTHRTKWYKKLSIPELEMDFNAFVEHELSLLGENNVQEELVPYTRYWLIDNDEFIGGVDIRHRLNELLMNNGGHIGYDIRPSKRERGYGNKILELTLKKAKELGVTRVLLTVDERNIVSRKVIEKHGGVLENQVPNPETSFNILRFWIENK